MERAAVNTDFDFSNLGMNEVIGIIENLLDDLPAQALMKMTLFISHSRYAAIFCMSGSSNGVKT